MITLNIPTSLSEIKVSIKKVIDNRYKHNRKLFNDIANEICDELKSGYWNSDISEYMRKEFTDYPNGKIYKIIRKYKSQVK